MSRSNIATRLYSFLYINLLSAIVVMTICGMASADNVQAPCSTQDASFLRPCGEVLNVTTVIDDGHGFPLSSLKQLLSERVKRHADALYEHGVLLDPEATKDYSNPVGAPMGGPVCAPFKNPLNGCQAEGGTVSSSKNHVSGERSDCGSFDKIAAKIQCPHCVHSKDACHGGFDGGFARVEFVDPNQSRLAAFSNGAYIQMLAYYHKEVVDELSAGTVPNLRISPECSILAGEVKKSADAIKANVSGIKDLLKDNPLDPDAHNKTIREMTPCKTDWLSEKTGQKLTTGLDSGKIKQVALHMCAARGLAESAFTQLAVCEIFARTSKNHTAKIRDFMISPGFDAATKEIGDQLANDCQRDCRNMSLGHACIFQKSGPTIERNFKSCFESCLNRSDRYPQHILDLWLKLLRPDPSGTLNKNTVDYDVFQNNCAPVTGAQNDRIPPQPKNPWDSQAPLFAIGALLAGSRNRRMKTGVSGLAAVFCLTCIGFGCGSPGQPSVGLPKNAPCPANFLDGCCDTDSNGNRTMKADADPGKCLPPGQTSLTGSVKTGLDNTNKSQLESAQVGAFIGLRAGNAAGGEAPNLASRPNIASATASDQISVTRPSDPQVTTLAPKRISHDSSGGTGGAAGGPTTAASSMGTVHTDPASPDLAGGGAAPAQRADSAAATYGSQGGSGGKGAAATRGLGFPYYGSGNSGAGGAGSGQTEFGLDANGQGQAAKTTTDEDPVDYFTRTGLNENLFKSVEKRYQKTQLIWAKPVIK